MKPRLEEESTGHPRTPNYLVKDHVTLAGMQRSLNATIDGHVYHITSNKQAHT